MVEEADVKLFESAYASVNSKEVAVLGSDFWILHNMSPDKSLFHSIVRKHLSIVVPQ